MAIRAPREKVWEATEDLSLIAKYHPDVGRVELLSGDARRAPGVEYQCFVTEGPRQGNCIERVIENIPYEMTSTLSVDDTWGLCKLLRDFVTDTSLSSADGQTTIVTMLGYYEPTGFMARIMNLLVIRRTMKKRGLDVLTGIKKMVEGDSSTPQ